MLAVPVVLALGYVVWELHNPNPRVKTSTVINRNSLLPHRFAGACLNCHKIQEVGPISMSERNMMLFRLTPQDQRLLQAGQRVEAPSVTQKLRMPAILRADPLAHRFVGVCSNCHVVMDVRPSEAFMTQAMRLAYQPLTGLGMSTERIRRGGVREDHSRELFRNIWGFIALAFFVPACGYILIRALTRADPKKYKGKFKIKRWFVLHEWLSSGFCLAAILHWYYSDRGNNFLHVALLMVIWLTLAGYVLRYRMAIRETQKNVKMVHTQRFLFYALVGLLVVGHFFAEFH
jgi:hypothetical protein